MVSLSGDLLGQEKSCNLSYNKYFYYLCAIKRKVGNGEAHDGDEIAPEIGAEDGIAGGAD